MSCQAQIPVVDVADLWNSAKPDECRKAVVSLAEAGRDYGFFYAKNHGIDRELQANVFKVWRDFLALPQAQKERVAADGAENFRGYFKFQSVAVSEDADWREGYYCAMVLPDDHPSKSTFPTVTQQNKWPDEPADFKNTVEAYVSAMSELSFKIISALAVGLGLERDYFLPMLTPYPMTHFGMYHYLPHSQEVGPNEFSLAEHTDPSLMIMTLQDDVGGLETCDDNGRWITVPPIPGTFAINLGNLLEVLSNGVYMSPRHRARKSQSGQSRMTVSFFLDPCVECVVKPAPRAKKPLIAVKDRQPKTDMKLPLIFGEFFAQKFRNAFN